MAGTRSSSSLHDRCALRLAQPDSVSTSALLLVKLVSYPPTATHAVTAGQEMPDSPSTGLSAMASEGTGAWAAVHDPADSVRR